MLRHRLPSACRLAFVLIWAFSLAAVAAAQVPPASGQATETERAVRDAVLARYRALPVQNGIVLVPRARVDGVDNVELREGTVAVNGRALTGAEVRERLGADAESILKLSYLGLPVQRRLLLSGDERRGREEASPEPAAPLEVPAESESPSAQDRDRSFRRETEARVRIGGNVTVDEDEQVNGPVVAVLGSVTIHGRVREDVVAVGGNVHLGPRADIRGDVTVVGGTIDRDPGARVSGQVNEVAFTVPNIRLRPGWDYRWNPWFGFDAGPWRAFRLLGSLLRMALFALLATLILLLAPRAVERVQVAVTTQFWKSALVGLLAQLFFVPVVVLVIVVLAVSIIGIPLLVLVPFGILAFFVALLMGFTGAACALSRAIQHRSSWSGSVGVAALVVGLAAIWGITTLGRIVGLGGGPLAVIGATLLFAGFVVEYAAWTVGLGGALLTRLGRCGQTPIVVPPMPGESVGDDVFPATPSV